MSGGLLGRTREVSELALALDAAKDARGSVHFLIGEPGIGKTRLADETARLAADRQMNVAWGRAWETAGAPPFFPWTEALDALASAELAAPDLGPHGHGGGDRVAAEATRARFTLFQDVLAFLRAASRTTPLLLILDDLHAADVPSLELLHFVARSVRSTRIVIIGTMRDAEARHAPVSEILARVLREGKTWSLKPLSPDEVADLVTEEKGARDEALAKVLVDLTDGNPLLVRESLRAIEHGGDVQELAQIAAQGGVATIVRARLDRLGDATKKLLEEASVLGREIDVALVASLHGGEGASTLRLLDEATAHGLVRRKDAGTYIFSHALVREAVLQTVAMELQRTLHLAATKALIRSGGEARAALIAHHALAALPLGDVNECAKLVRAAAAVARRQLAQEEAVALLDRARPSLGGLDPREEIELLLALGWATTEKGELVRGRDFFRDATTRARALGDAALLARAALGQGGEYVLGEVRDELLAVLREALDALPKEATALRARLLSRLAAALTPSRTPAEPIALAREAWTMRDKVDLETRVDLGVAVGSTFIDFTAPEERIPVEVALVDDAREIGDSTIELRGLTRLATALLEQGNFARADAVIAQRAALAERVGHPRHRWQSALLRSMRAMPDGRFAECDAAIEEARAIAREVEDANADHVIAIHRFWLFLLRGDTEGLRQHQPAVLATLERMPEREQHFAVIEAVVRAHSGDAHAARTALEGVGDAGVLQATMWAATLAEAVVLAEASERYAGLYEKLCPAEDRNATWGPFGFACSSPIGGVLGSLASKLGRPYEAHFEKALAKSTNAKAHRMWVLLLSAEARPNDEAANALLAEATKLAEELGVPAVLRRATIARARTREAPAPASTRSTSSEISVTLRAEDKYYVLGFEGRTHRYRATRGFPMLARLIEHEGQELHVLDLAADPEDPNAVADLGDAGEMLDDRARAQYKQRMMDLREELEEAESFSDRGRIESIREEIHALERAVAQAFGLGGRERRASAAGERARITVQRRVREAIKKIEGDEPALARHLDWAIRTGTFCAYEPKGRKRD